VWKISPKNLTAHSLTDTSPMKLFDSGLRAPAGFTYQLTTAGSYRIVDAASQHLGTVKVQLLAPPNAVVGVTVPVTWASAPPASGFVVDVRVQNPGSTTWTAW
jgi:hypothetical protein